jgi:translation initiation factor 5B
MGDDVDFNFEEATPALVLGKKKKKKKKPAEPKADGDDADGDAKVGRAPEVDAAAEDVKDAKDAGTEVASGFSALQDKDSDGDGATENCGIDEGDGENAKPVLTGKKKKKKKAAKAETPVGIDGGDAEFDALLAELGDSPAAAPAEQQSDAVAPQSKAKKKKKAGKAETTDHAPDTEFDALLAELGDTPAEPSTPAEQSDAAVPKSKAKKKKSKARAADKADGEDEDLDALLAELNVGSGVAADAPAEVFGTGQDEEPAAAEDGVGAGGVNLDTLMAEMDGGDGPSGNAKKKKKKTKKAGVKTEASGEGDGEVNVDGGPSSQKKGAKKESAAVRRLREQRERMAEEEVRLEQMRKEEEARMAEEERIEAEKLEAKERQKAARKEAEKARKARLKAEGKLLSKAEAAKKRKAELFKQQALASGLVAAANADTGESKVVYSKRKRVQKSSSAGGDSEEKHTSAVSEKELELPQSTDEALDAAAAVSADAPEATADGQGATADVAVEDAVVPDEWDAESSEEENAVESSSNGVTGKDGAAGAASSAAGGDGNESDDSESSTEESDSDEFDSDEFEGMGRPEIAAERRKYALRKSFAKEAAAALEARSADDLRSPVICILGHVDTGKTKILDRIRRTNVQDGEAGGITQQIGATYFPMEAIKRETMKLDEGKECPYNVPSLLIIDTPGHESFTNLRSRGSSLCDIAILVIDIMHGLEPQTRESIDLLKLRKTPFVVALNKCDRLYDWQAISGNNPFRDSLNRQKSHVREEFNRRAKETMIELATVGFNTALYWENEDVRKTVSIVPTSAITGEGMPDLLMLITSLPQNLLTERLMFNPTLEATVLEVKVIEGLGTTIDIILTGGTIKEGDTIVVVGLDGPIVSTIRALLTPHPMKEMRVRGQYHHHKQIRAAQGIKISADGMDKAVAGTQLLVARDPSNEDEMAYLREEVMKDFSTILQNVDKSGEGVYVMASTLGSLEALLEFLRTSEIPVSGINIGPVFKKDVTRASAMLEKRKEFAAILAFDVPVEKEAREMAEDAGVTIFTADIIYNLFDMFMEHMANQKKMRQEEVKDEVVFPCVLKILQEHIFNKKDPIVLGVDVAEGMLRVGCPLVVRSGDAWLDIGRVISMEINTKSAVIARAGESVCVKIQSNKTSHITYGRHFTWTDALVSKLSRKSIDILKSDFRNDLGKVEWQLVIKLKRVFGII